MLRFTDDRIKFYLASGIFKSFGDAIDHKRHPKKMLK